MHRGPSNEFVGHAPFQEYAPVHPQSGPGAAIPSGGDYVAQHFAQAGPFLGGPGNASAMNVPSGSVRRTLCSLSDVMLVVGLGLTLSP